MTIDNVYIIEVSDDDYELVIEMRPEDRATARRQLDKRLQALREIEGLKRPPRGWIKAIREALGMTTAQLGRRLGVSQPRVVTIENNEIKGGITIETLERAAQALDCQLVYTLVPRRPLEKVVEDRARQLARRQIEPTRHSMGLEAQSVTEEEEREQIERLARSLAESVGSELWEDQ